MKRDTHAHAYAMSVHNPTNDPQQNSVLNPNAKIRPKSHEQKIAATPVVTWAAHNQPDELLYAQMNAGRDKTHQHLSPYERLIPRQHSDEHLVGYLAHGSYAPNDSGSDDL